VQGTITLAEVIDKMDAGDVFSIRFVTCDHKKDSGGELVDIYKAVKNGSVKKEHRVQSSLQPVSRLLLKDPNHFENSTRNIKILNNGEIRKLHIRLIRRFNGRVVL